MLLNLLRIHPEITRNLFSHKINYSLMPMWPSIVKGFVKKKSQFGAEGNELENALTRQWLEPIMNTKSKTAANKICSFLKEPANAAFQNDSPAHTASTCSKTVH